MCKNKLTFNDIIYATLYIASLVFFLILIGMCISQLKQLNITTTRTLPNDTIQAKQHLEIIVPDTIKNADKALTSKLDTVITIIDSWNNYCDEKIVHGLDDLRQETNNVIEKQNGWLSFWIAILAIVGALFPFLFQLKAQRDLDSEIKRMKDAVEKQIDDTKNNLKEFSEKKISLEIANLTYAIISIAENAWHIDNAEKSRYINDILENLSNKLEDYFKLVKTRTEPTSSYSSDLKLILIKLLTAYNAVPSTVNRYKVRLLSDLIASIKTVLNNLYDDKYQNKHDLDFALDKLHNKVKSFRL